MEPAIAFARSLENFERPPWLYRLRGGPPAKQRFRAPPPVTDADLTLCRRLIDAYRLAQSEARQASGMWSHSIFEQRQRELTDALREGRPAAVARLLAAMFRSDFVLGMARGSLGRKWSRGPIARAAWLIELRKIVALGEAIGAARMENPEQGGVAPALHDGIDELVAGIEQRLGLSLDFPDAGAAWGVVVADRLITPETPDLVYGAARLRDAIDTHAPPSDGPRRIVEIGGGYGGMAYWLLLMMDARYVIVDLPVVGVLQGYFLSQALGHDAVALYGETPAQVTIVPDHALDQVPTPFEALANKDSLPEIPLAAAEEYLEWARAAAPPVFYSYNHESGTVFDGVEQNVVCELVDRVGGFTRVRRDVSPLRRGYVQEVYVPASGGR
ncbi:MAG: putative sugar O-methyltransferase [Thermoleophilia bacterium]